MYPAISSLPRLFAMILLMGLLLLLPVILAVVGLPSKAEMYRGITREAGSFAFMGHEFFEEKGDIDMLFFGASLLRAGIDGEIVEQGLSTHLRRPAKVMVAGVNWAGMDLQYFLLRDLLEHRHVHTIVLSIPIGQQETSMPHVQLFRMLRYGDYPDAFEGMNLPNCTSMYATMVLGAPRQTLNLIRNNRVNETETRIPSRAVSDEVGYYGAPFIRDQRPPPVLPAESMIYSQTTAEQFRFIGKKMSTYHNHFLKRMAKLFQEHNVDQVIFLNLPLDGDRGSPVVSERQQWAEEFGPKCKIVGISSARLFAGFPEDEFLRFYSDQHLNRNGREYFTAAVLPALVSIYGKP